MVKRHQTPKVGERVKITQYMSLGAIDTFVQVMGVVIAEEDCPVESSSFSGAEDNVFWIKRLFIEKGDGQLSAIVVDENTRIEQCEGG